MRQEQVVFGVTVAILGLLVWSGSGGDTQARRRRSTGGSAELDHHRAPDVGVVLPRESRVRLARELFSQPRDTHALPPLDLVEPPRAPFPMLLPPCDPGPSPRHYDLLRLAVPARDEPELFAELGAPEEIPDDLAFLEEGGEERERRPMIAALRELQESQEEVDPFAGETPAQTLARIAGYKRQYDWITRKSGQTVYGRIMNADRYGLKTDPSRAAEPLLFVQVDPQTGRELFANVGGGALPEPRDSVAEFEFADTVANSIELERRALQGGLSRADYDAALALADFCVRNRLEAPRALEVAEDLYRRCTGFDAADPAPRLGLARCYEAGFDFERAFAEYESLLADFPHRAEVHARLGLLEERFLMDSGAEERLREAVRINRGSWEARWSLGTFLARHGRYEEAIEHLQQANRSAPQDPEAKHVRVQIRSALGSALLAHGEVSEAHAAFAQARSADAEDQRALAGLLSTEMLEPSLAATNGGGAARDDADEQGAGFELLLARGIGAVVAGDFTLARDHLLASAAADPLRADLAWAALSFLAERSGNLEEALRFAEDAISVDPTNAYAHLLRGRLLGRQDDWEGARAALSDALAIELDFEDALVALGEVAFRLGRFEDADRYLDRALALAGDRAEVRSLRGLVLLRLGAVAEAREQFQAALGAAPEDPVALAGVAWCTYLSEDPQEALILLANLDEARRALPEDDPYRLWSRAQIERVQDHLEKEAWTDGFNRKRLGNDWLTREGDGIEVTLDLDEGAVRVAGSFAQGRAASVYREFPANAFVSIEASVWVSAASNARAGLFIARERQRRDEYETTDEVSVSRQKEGSLQVRFQRSGNEPTVTDMEQVFPTSQWVRLRIERTGESSDSAVTVSMQGIPLIEGLSMPSLGRGSTNALLVGLFVEGEAGRQVDARMDDVEIVYRR